MKFTKYGHSCFLVEAGDARILVDPGSYSDGFQGLRDLDAILVTHNHPDHMTPEIIQGLMKGNQGALVLADEDSAATLLDTGVTARAVYHGDTEIIAGVPIEVIGSEHAEIHPSMPRAKNVGYKFADKLFFPGDALTVPVGGIEVLAIPAAAPWSKISETIDYLLEVKPKVAIPVHDGILSRPSLFAQMLGQFGAKAGIELRVVENGAATEL